MDWNRKQQDLTHVFDARYKANHNDDVKKMKERDRALMGRLYEPRVKPVREKMTIDRGPVRSSKDEGLERLNGNMNRLRNQQNNSFRNFGK